MDTKPFSNKFIAAQIAGSCRLDSVRVSEEDERVMCDIISGRIDAPELRRRLVEQFKLQNQLT